MDANKAKELLTLRTPNVVCAGCQERRLHTREEMEEYHPLAGHGYTHNQGGWSHAALVAEAEGKAAKERRRQAVEASGARL